MNVTSRGAQPASGEAVKTAVGAGTASTAIRSTAVRVSAPQALPAISRTV